MGLSGCYAIMKYVVFFLNFIFWITGLCTIVLSVWMLTDPTFYISMAQDESSYYSGVYLLLAVGILLFIVGFLGCCGALKESQVMLVLFFCVLLIILVAEISAGAWAYSKSDHLEELVRDTVTTTVRHEYGVVQSRTDTFDQIQKGLKCCGANGPDDWLGSKFNKGEGLDLSISSDIKRYKVPPSCCVDPLDTTCHTTDNILAAPISPNIFNQGCSSKLIEALQEYMNTVVGIAIVIGVAQLFGLIFSLVLCCAIHQRDARYKA